MGGESISRTALSGTRHILQESGDRLQASSALPQALGTRTATATATWMREGTDHYSLSVFSSSPILPSRYLHEYLLVPTYLPKVVIGHRTISPCMIEVLVGFEPNLL